MTAISNLFARCRYPADKTDLPVVMLMHGWSSNADIFTEAQLAPLAAQDVFICVPGMRGRNGADGANDASGREIYDIYDALQQVRSSYAAIVSATKAVVVGFSNGGGNALAAACKFPDTWSLVVDHFGISDYGRDGTNGWYQQNIAGYPALVAAAVGGTPAQVPNNYYARDATAAIANYSGGELLLFHDEADSIVPVIHSQRIVTALGEADNFTAAYNVAYAHANYVQASEAVWVPKAKANAAWTVPESGTVTVIGYIKTKRFEVRLGTLVDHVATVVYGTVANQYTVTPLTGNMSVTIIQADGKTATQAITGATTITVA